MHEGGSQSHRNVDLMSVRSGVSRQPRSNAAKEKK